MTRKVAVFNTAASAVLLAAAVGFANQPDDPEGPEGTTLAAPLPNGEDLVVKATGNLNSPRLVGLPFAGSPGLVTKVNVAVGDTVEAGAVLARVDARGAHSQIRRAEVSVRAAKAQLRTTQGRVTPARRKQSQAQITVAIQQLANAQQAVAQARETFRRNAAAQAAAVESAAEQLRAAQRNVSRSASASEARSRTSPIIPPGSSTEVRTESSDRSVSASTSTSAVAGARGGLSAAQEARESTLLSNAQTIRRLRHQATLAARQLGLARADAEANLEGPLAGEVDTAKAQIDQARLDLRDAREALDDTYLRAPFRSTVVDIAGSVGETPVGAVRGSSVTGSSGPGEAEKRNPATRTGFVILADLTRKSVTATVIEAEIDQIAVGQSAAVTFPATGAEVPGTVTAIDEQETVVGTVVTYDVHIALDESAANLRLGQSSDVRIFTGQRQPRIVPNAAISRVGERSVVQVRRGQQLVKIPVTTAPAGPDVSEIRSPLLLPDDEVVIPARREDTEPTPVQR